MRGKAFALGFFSVTLGITPAYAGKSRHFQDKICTSRDHPRLCGEKGFGSESRNTTMGSPPPMRGKVPTVPRIAENYRITPAYAGKRSKPHSIPLKIYGSPPPMRGKGQAVLDFLRRARITPAYAGKSPSYAFAIFAR